MTKNIELYKIITEEKNISETKKLIIEGATPLAVIWLDSEGKNKKQAFDRVIAKRDLNLLTAVLEACLIRYKQTNGKENPLDLSKIVLNGENTNIDKENILQNFICRSDLPAIKTIIKYAKDTKQDVESILNAPILDAEYKFASSHSLSEDLLQYVSSVNINANLTFANLDTAELITVSKFWNQWISLGEVTNLNDLPKVSFPINLVFEGPRETLPYLMEHGLIVNKGSLDGMLEICDSPESWEKMKSNVCRKEVSPISMAQKATKREGIYFAANLGNVFNMHKIPVVINVDYTPLKKIVENKEQELMYKYNIDKIASDAEGAKHHAAEAMAGVASLNTQVAALTKEMQELKQAFSELAEAQKKHYRRTLASDEIALQLFNHLEDNTKAQLEGGKIAALKIFNAHPSSTTQQHANSAIAVLQFATNSIPIAQNVLACIAFCQQEYAKIQTQIHYKNIADKTLGIDAPIVAINVAGHIAGKYLTIKEMLQSKYNNLEWLKNNMWANVQTATKKLGTMQGNFVNHDHLVGYLCADAINRLSNAQLYKIGMFENHPLNRPQPGFMPRYAASSTAVSAPTTVMNMAYTEGVNNSLGYANYDTSTGTPPLVFSSKSGKKTLSPKDSDNTIQSGHSNSGHGNRSSREKKAATGKCSIM